MSLTKRTSAPARQTAVQEDSHIGGLNRVVFGPSFGGGPAWQNPLLLKALYGIGTLGAFLFFLLAFGKQNLSGMRQSASWDSSTQIANTMIAIIGPSVAAKSAWDLSTLRGGGVFEYPNVRSHSRIIVHTLLPTALWGMVCMLLTQALCAPYAQDSLHPCHVVVMATGPLMVTACALFGMACSVVLPRVWSTSVALVLVFLWLLFPSAMEPMWLRHLTGYEDAVGMPGTMLSMRGILAPVLFCIAIALGCIALTGVAVARFGNSAVSIRWLLPLPLGSLIALGTAISFALPFGMAPVVARNTETVCRRQEATTTCVWPEHERYLPELMHEVHDLNGVLERNGIPVPAMVSERLTDRAALTVSVRDVIHAQSNDRRSMLLSAYLDYSAGVIDGCGITETLPEYEMAVSVIAQRLGADPMRVPQGESADAVPKANRGEDLGWTRKAIDAARAECLANAY